MTGLPLPATEIVDLLSYPVKGCAGVSVPSTPLTDAGLAHDRAFMVIDENGVFRTQRRWPHLAQIQPAISDDRIELSAPGAGSIAVDVDVTGPRRAVDLFGTGYRGIDQGDPVAEWLSDVLGARSRLVRVPPEHDRATDGETPGTSGYADSCAVHVVSRSSLDLLNERLPEPLPMDRFRPNIVVDGWDAHDEDRAGRIRAGDAVLGFAKLAIRCAVTTVDQATGRRSGPEPLRTLARYRRVPGEGIAFGAKFAVLRRGTLSVGDPVVVETWR
ncbi:MOSC N-terminal beta barrel domain-containing protein [Saccharopolyspora hirsuta]|uniref:MOSC domain-containing protein n=1 Tax=Saccharopolyspora hirsuta TaxID=1837 RepID=UPI001FE416AF|nr:MOSC N-terminal beta barrel domain-containing protein [Saccharopolyspora hirsuta]